MTHELHPAQVGPYRLTSRLGAGGMGEVFLGRTSTGQQVAVKLMNPELADSAVFRQRFAREVAAAKRLSGRRTAQVVDADPDADPPWLATAYIAGPTLHDRVLDDGPLPSDALRELGAGLAEGLTAIHECGLVHRDLKPGNVIMAADGPRVIDFGVALAADASTLTASGTVMGTYAYTSPEQIRADRVTPASDVFALGCVLVFAATGQGPFDASTIPAVVHRILGETPDLAGVPDAFRDLVGACLAKDPAQRPSPATIQARLSGGAVAMESTRVDPRPRPSPRPQGKGIGRRGLLFGGIAAAATAAIAVPTVLLWPDSPNGSGSSTKPFLTLKGHKGDITSMVFLDDGRLATGGADKTIRLWNTATGEQITKRTGHDGSVVSLCWDVESDILSSAGLDGTVRIWGVEDDAYDDVIDIGRDGVHALAYHDIAGIGCGLDNGDIQLWHLHASWKTHTLTGHAGRITSLAASDSTIDGELTPIMLSAAAEGKDSAIRVWNMDKGKQIGELAGHDHDIRQLAMPPDGGYLASAGDDGTVRIWDVEARKSVNTLTGHSELVYGVAHGPQGELASGSADGTIRLWNADTGANTATLTGGPRHPSALAFSDDGQLIAAGDKLWRIA